MSALRIGEVFTYGRDREKAQQIMAACKTLGIDQHIVRATDTGFIMPEPVWDEVERMRRPTWSDEQAVI